MFIINHGKVHDTQDLLVDNNVHIRPTKLLEIGFLAIHDILALSIFQLTESDRCCSEEQNEEKSEHELRIAR